MRPRIAIVAAIYGLLPACQSISNKSKIPEDRPPEVGRLYATPAASRSDSRALLPSGEIVYARHPKPWHFWIDPESIPARVARLLRLEGNPEAARIEYIAQQATATWYRPSQTIPPTEIMGRQMAEARTQEAYALIVIQALPYRNCSALVPSDYAADNYRSWIQSLVKIMGAGRALIILEPKALAEIDCLSAYPRLAEERYALLREAVLAFRQNQDALIYLDISGLSPFDAGEAASRLEKSGVAEADGFALNTGLYETNERVVKNGQALRKLLGDKNFVIDTSRNGSALPPGTPSCNPRGAALGLEPNSETQIMGLDAYLWLKQAGESDGVCYPEDPLAGDFSPELAAQLAKNAGM